MVFATQKRIQNGILAKLKEKKTKITDSDAKIRKALSGTVLAPQLIKRALELKKQKK